VLKNYVTLVGKVNNDELAYWYSAADFYISASHNEGSGYALIECMACGCIPIVTGIPPFIAITDTARLGLFFNVGDHGSLTEALVESENIDSIKMSEDILHYFSSHLSFKAIAEDIYNVCKTLMAK
jgi:glycosyltransferase involved in cell wall biosynthesis